MEIRDNPRIAATICQPHSRPFETPCRGLQLEGSAMQLDDVSSASQGLAVYMARFPNSERFHADVTDVTGTAERRVYRINPERIVLFDEENFSTRPQQELILGR